MAPAIAWLQLTLASCPPVREKLLHEAEQQMKLAAEAANRHK